ncbi:MAG: metalloprotease TldD [Mariprofundaceae bacterium]
MSDAVLPVSNEILTKMFHHLVPKGADDADLYLEHSVSESLALEEGRVKHVSASTSQGVGARVVIGELSGHAYTDRLDTKSLIDCSQAARAIIESKSQCAPISVQKKPLDRALYAANSPMATVSIERRKVLLEKLDALARRLDPRVKQVFANISSSFSDIQIIRHHGEHLHDARPLVRLNISVVVEQKGKRETGAAGGGGRFDLERLLTGDEAERLTKEAVRIALLNLDAVAAPAGSMPVVLGSGWPGILLHEAIGHGLEGDFNRKGTSAFSGRIGERVAAPGVTVVDDGTIADRRGSLNIDDEGTKSGCTTLIEDGILTGYLLDRQNARLMAMQPTGNGRRESYAHPVLPRMTNTFMRAGSDDPKGIIASLKRGIYAVNFGGGQVDITSGKFVFTTSEAYWVEDGEIKHPVKSATLIGNGPDVLTKVSMIGDDLAMDPGVGTCGKEGQSVPVGVGLPTIRIDELIVGGAES